MMNEDFKAICTKLGLTQSELGKKLGVARNTVTRWEMGIRGIPEPVVRLLEFLQKEEQAIKKIGKRG